MAGSKENVEAISDEILDKIMSHPEFENMMRLALINELEGKTGNECMDIILASLRRD